MDLFESLTEVTSLNGVKDSLEPPTPLKRSIPIQPVQPSVQLVKVRAKGQRRETFPFPQGSFFLWCHNVSQVGQT